jgi:uncharacterized SAM-binding protein YcdF (DUF218 family)
MIPKPRRRWLIYLLRFAAISLLVWLLVCTGLALYIYSYGTTERARPADVIVVLGSGLFRDGSPGPSLWVRSRHAATLYHDGYATTIICTGGQAATRPRSEADACREVLGYYAVPASAVVLEANSYSTEENAMRVRALMQANNWQSALVVTQGYHILRATHLFEKYNVDAAFSPVPAEQDRPRHFSLMREVAALQWQLLKDTLDLPFTSVPLI